MHIGYARVSMQEQDAQAQITALRAVGCKRIFQEKASGGCWDRPELHRLLEQLRKGDVVVVWKLDRLSRSLKDLLGSGADGWTRWRPSTQADSETANRDRRAGYIRAENGSRCRTTVPCPPVYRCAATGQTSSE